MRRGAPLRFVGTAIGGWTAVRAAALWTWAVTVVPAVVSHEVARLAPLLDHAVVGQAEAADAAPTAATPATPNEASAAVSPPPPVRLARTGEARVHEPGPPLPSRHELSVAGGGSTVAPPLPPSPQPMLAQRTDASRLRGSAWLFVRGGHADPLATGGQLGGGQAGLRLEYRLNPSGPTRFAAAARLSRPLNDRGLEAAAGLDWHPLPTVPVRLSIERRFRLERGGRNAWSAYAAGGFYREVGHGVILDGYAQAGVVGARSRDLFVDGALRAARRVTGGVLPVALGAGLWGAHQPGAARLDVGPHASVPLPIPHQNVSLALDGRFRVAGQTRPGSGVALTLASDF